MNIYMAPMEGITDFTFRNTFAKYYEGVDKYFTPFLSPNSTESFTTKELNEINPAHNEGKNVVPQFLTCHAEHFLWAMDYVYRLGYKEVNLNLGCPSGTVTAKKKGSGFLMYPEELEEFFETVFDSELAQKMTISVKTRLGYHEPGEFFKVLDIYNKFPISELTIHPRIRTDMYKGPIRREFFDYAVKNAKMPLVYNGEIKTSGDAMAVGNAYPEINTIMLGRGLVSAPWLPGMIKDKEKKPDIETFKAFHRDLFAEYRERFSGPVPILARYKEFWAHFLPNFALSEKYEKDLKKAKTLQETESVINRIMAGGFRKITNWNISESRFEEISRE